ncbi:MAG: NAD-dependent malic enzyme [Rhodothermia bacterium]|nr:MAG: NAD-dependent malic enzyme [Rhodothermia bacterium]
MDSDRTPRGSDLLGDHRLNKSTAFTVEERDRYGLRGLLPHGVFPQEMQKARVLQNMRRKVSDIGKYIFLGGLQDRNERLFFRTVIDEIDEIMPLIYTPTVGQACREFSHIFRRPTGFHISIDDKGDIRRILDNWPNEDVRIIVITDGERILGLGDLGANGMGIPVGKLSLYVACAGIRPEQCLPVMLDVGTDNDEIRTDPLYLGYPHRRVRGQAYLDLVEEFVNAVQDKFPRALIQFEDFLTPNAILLLELYRDRILCFNDDIQGTAAVALAGVHAATRISGIEFKNQRILFFGAGSAATGIGELMVSSLEEEGLERNEAYEHIWFIDSKGLVVSSRDDLAEHKKPFAHDHEWMTFADAVPEIKPHVLIGVAGRGGSFTQEIVETMSSVNERPTIFALSNPTSKAECTAEQAYEWSDGRAIFASGSPFGPVEYRGRTFKPGQGNNSYIFPGVGLGIIACGARRVTDDMFMAAAKTLAGMVHEEDIGVGSLFPPLSSIRKVSLQIAIAVAEAAYETGLATETRPENLEEHIAGLMYDPTY